MHAVALGREHSASSARALVVQDGVRQVAADVQQKRWLVCTHNVRKARLAAVCNVPAHGHNECRPEWYVRASAGAARQDDWAGSQLCRPTHQQRPQEASSTGQKHAAVV